MPDTTARIPAAAVPADVPEPLVGQTEVAIHPTVARLRRTMLIATLAFFLVGVPGLNILGAVADDRVQTLGRYLSFALVALGLDLVWGYTGMLSLCQALFFCIGGYAMAMHLSLPEGGGIYDVPQFLSFVYYGHADPLPPFWKPFKYLVFAVAAGVTIAGGLATLFGFFIFRSRVRGVYFSILTQAVAWGVWLLVCQNEMLLGGTNGLTNFNKALTQHRGWILSLYLLTCGTVIGGYLTCRWVIRSRVGRVMVAIRDKEMRLYFAGYKPHSFKVFVFALAGVLGAVGGMLYPLQFTIISPQDMNVSASILVVIMVAVGGRGRLWGAVFGAVLVLVARSSWSSSLASMWPYIYGGLFIAVVLFFPDGFGGLWDKVERRIEEGAGAGAIAAAVAPIAVVVGFLSLEALGLTPGWAMSVRVGVVPLFWLLLVFCLALAFAAELYVTAAMKADKANRGFPVTPARAA